MVISRLQLSKIEKNFNLIQEFLAEARTLALLSKEDFLSEKRNAAAAESYLRRSLEAVFDIGRHILAKSYGFKELEYKKIAVGLGEKGVVDKEYSKTLMKMAGYRNRMVHLYNEISPAEIYDILTSHLSDIDRFVLEITKFIESYRIAAND